MNRRQFISGILSSAIAPLILPGANRLWKRTPESGLYQLHGNRLIYPDDIFLKFSNHLAQKLIILNDVMSDRNNWHNILESPIGDEVTTLHQ